MADKQKPTNNIISFPNAYATDEFSDEDLMDVFQTTLELAIYASMRQKEYERIIYYFYSLPPFEQKLLKQRNREMVAYHAEMILQSPQAQQILMSLFSSWVHPDFSNNSLADESDKVDELASQPSANENQATPLVTSLAQLVTSYQQCLMQTIPLTSELQSVSPIALEQLQAITLQTSFFDDFKIRVDELVSLKLKIDATEQAESKIIYGEIGVKNEADFVQQLKILQSLLAEETPTTLADELGIIYGLTLTYQDGHTLSYQVDEWPIGVLFDFACHQVCQETEDQLNIYFYPMQKLSSSFLLDLLACEEMRAMLELKLKELLIIEQPVQQAVLGDYSKEQTIYHYLRAIEKRPANAFNLLQTYQLQLTGKLNDNLVNDLWVLTDYTGKTYALERLKKVPTTLMNVQYDLSACQKMYHLNPEQAFNYFWNAFVRLLIFAY